MKLTRVTLAVDPGVRNCGWALYRGGKLTMGMLVNKKSPTEGIRERCHCIHTMIQQLLGICRDNNVTFVLVEWQAPRVHYTVQIFVGMLTYGLISKKLNWEFVSPKSLGTIDDNFQVPTKQERAVRVREYFGLDGKYTLHETDAGFLIYHYIGRKI